MSAQDIFSLVSHVHDHDQFYDEDQDHGKTKAMIMTIFCTKNKTKANNLPHFDQHLMSF